MKHLATLLLLCVALSAQTVTVEIAVKRGLLETLIWKILLRPKTALKSFACVATEMEPGESTECTVTLNQAARMGGVAVTVNLPAGFTGPASAMIPAGSATVTFTVMRQDVIAGDPRISTVAYTWRVPGCAPQRFVEVLTACCARTDRCGLPDDEIAWEPCAE